MRPVCHLDGWEGDIFENIVEFDICKRVLKGVGIGLESQALVVKRDLDICFQRSIGEFFRFPSYTAEKEYDLPLGFFPNRKRIALW
jgi:hypothetical protein